MDNNNRCWNNQHVHEVTGSTFIAERNEDPHNHRFATVSGEAIPFRNSHVHRITFRTDSYEGHVHEFSALSSPAIFIADGRHVHFVHSFTTFRDGHVHEFRVATLIEDPIEED